MQRHQAQRSHPRPAAEATWIKVQSQLLGWKGRKTFLAQEEKRSLHETLAFLQIRSGLAEEILHRNAPMERFGVKCNQTRSGSQR
jgi:hypothetical protein